MKESWRRISFVQSGFKETMMTQPTHMPHGVPPRGLETTTASSTTAGRFGRMFRHVPVISASEDSLVALGKAMIQPLEDGKLDKPLGVPDDDENLSRLETDELRLPAGYTYFGQFVDHDITFDPASSLTQQADPDALTNFRTPRLDLDNLYGRGPADQPYLYDTDGHFLLGTDLDPDHPETAQRDLCRSSLGRAIIGDPRNDENLIVSQLQVAFLQFHNRVLDDVKASGVLSSDDTFKLAQRTVRWHYQWVVLHDFLPRLVGKEVVDDLLSGKEYVAPGGVQTVIQRTPVFYKWRDDPYMPIEFSVAAYRYGHTMARPSYVINDFIPLPLASGGTAERIPLFTQEDGPARNLNGFQPLPQQWGVQWKYFLPGIKEPAGENDAHLPQPSYKLDAQLSNPLGALPGSTAAPELIIQSGAPSLAQVLAVRNLIRGLRLRLPAGQDVARAMGIDPLTNDQLFAGIELDDAVRQDLGDHTPLWFYILKEAEVLGKSSHLGPVGGRIVAEVLVGLVDGDPLSYLSVDPTWRPTLPSRLGSAEFTLSDLINFARPGLEGPAPTTYGA